MKEDWSFNSNNNKGIEQLEKMAKSFWKELENEFKTKFLSIEHVDLNDVTLEVLDQSLLSQI